MKKPSIQSIGKHVNTKKVQQMLTDSTWVLHERYSAQLPSSSAYYETHPKYGAYVRETTVLKVNFDGSGRMWETLEGFEEFLFELETVRRKAESHQNFHVLHERIPEAQSFPEHIPNLIEQLPNQFSIDAAKLDFTIESLKPLTQAVRRVGRRILRGHIEMRLAQDKVTYVPWVIVGDRGTDIGFALYRALEEDHPFSLGSVSLAIERLEDLNPPYTPVSTSMPLIGHRLNEKGEIEFTLFSYGTVGTETTAEPPQPPTTPTPESDNLT